MATKIKPRQQTLDKLAALQAAIAGGASVETVAQLIVALPRAHRDAAYESLLAKNIVHVRHFDR